MRIFDANGKRYVEINGKTFFCLRFYTSERSKPAFVQVFGTAPLTKDDLPDKAWELIATRGPEGRVFTAWKPAYFKPNAKERLYVGATAAGSVRLLVDANYPGFPESSRAAFAARVAAKAYGTGVYLMTDRGSADVPAARLDNGYMVRRALENITNGVEEKAA